MTTPKTRREQEFEAFKKAWEEYPSQDNEGFVPDRGGFKCGWFAALRWADSTPAPSEQGEEEMKPDELIPRSEADRLVREAVERERERLAPIYGKMIIDAGVYVSKHERERCHKIAISVVDYLQHANYSHRVSSARSQLNAILNPPTEESGT